MFGNGLAISDMSWECLSQMNPGFSEVSFFSLELLAAFVWGNRDTSKVHCLLNKHLGMWRKTWAYKNPTNIPWSTNCRVASLLQVICKHLAFQNIYSALVDAECFIQHRFRCSSPFAHEAVVWFQTSCSANHIQDAETWLRKTASGNQRQSPSRPLDPGDIFHS